MPAKRGRDDQNTCALRIASLKGLALAPRDCVRYGERSVRLVVEEWVRPCEPLPPPAKHLRSPPRDDTQRCRRWRVRLQRSDGRTLVDAAERQSEHFVARTTVNLVAHERMDEPENGETRAGGGVGD